ncbi:MAG: hypothetical protein NVS3B26_15150 [Mycobacteriales bacterium]
MIRGGRQGLVTAALVLGVMLLSADGQWGLAAFSGVTSSGQILSCMNNARFTVRIVDHPACNPSETLLSWNQRGPAGSSGSPGAAGPAGATGPRGADGTAGPAGSPGPVGPAGAVGATGATGATGPTGLQGAAGSPAVAGPAWKVHTYGYQSNIGTTSRCSNVLLGSIPLNLSRPAVVNSSAEVPVMLTNSAGQDASVASTVLVRLTDSAGIDRGAGQSLVSGYLPVVNGATRALELQGTTPIFTDFTNYTSPTADVVIPAGSWTANLSATFCADHGPIAASVGSYGTFIVTTAYAG